MVPKSLYTETDWSITIGPHPLLIDRKDQIIIQAITFNARIGLTTLAKIVRLSKSSVLHRMRILEKKGVIQNYCALIDIHKIGFTMYSILIKTKMPYSQRKEYVTFLQKIQNLNQIITLTSSRWDFLIRVYCDTNLDETITQITTFPNIADIEILRLDSWHYSPPHHFPLTLSKRELPKTSKNLKPNTSHPTPFSYDLKDISLLEAISTHARMPLAQIGEHIGLSGFAVKQRLQKLESAGVISCYFPALDIYRLGYTPVVLFFKVYNRTKISLLINYLTEETLCTGVLENCESWNVIAFVMVRDSKELSVVEDALLTRFGEIIHTHEIAIAREQPYSKIFPEWIQQRLRDRICK